MEPKIKLGRAKKKLRYIQTEDQTSNLKVKDSFSLKNLDNIFDDLDSASDSITPQLSPLPKSDEWIQEENGDCCLKPSSPFGAEEPEILAPENCIQEDHLNEKDTPFREIAPIKTSSPIDVVPVVDGAGDTERPETSPILFVVENEEPSVEDLSNPPMTSACPKKFLQEDSESVVSPPARLEFGKPTTKDAVSVQRCLPVPDSAIPSQECQTSAPETREESQIMDGSPNLSPPILAQNNSEYLQKEQPKNQAIELKFDTEVPKSSFQKMLINAFQSKTSWKQEAQKQQARAPSPLEMEDDFMILDDDAPILFSIPRKPVTCQKEKCPPGVFSAKPDSNNSAPPIESSSPKLIEDAKKNGVEPVAAKTKKTKAKRGKTCDQSVKDIVAQAAPEERAEPLTGAAEVVPVCEQYSVPETCEDANVPGKEERKRKMMKSGKLCKKDGKEDNPAEIPVEKPASKRKKPVKLTGGDDNGQQDPAPKVKKKSNKANSAVDVQAGKTLGSAKHGKPGHDNATLTNEQVPKEQEQVNKLQKNTEPVLKLSDQPDVQSTTAVKQSNKQPSLKQGSSKRTVKAKKVEKTKEGTKIKEVPVSEAPVSPEGAVTSRRKRKPPGEWWLTSDNQNEGNTQEHEVAVLQSLEELKSKKKMKKKETPAILVESTEEHASRNEPNKPGTVQKMTKKVKTSNPSHEQKKTVSKGRRKPKLPKKSAVLTQQEIPVMIPVSVVGEEVAVDENGGQFSPVASSPPSRQHTLTPGEQSTFPKIYARSAQKQPPSAPQQPECLPGKRQRKPTSNWWQLPQSQGSVESSSSLLNCSAQKSHPQMVSPSGAFDKVSSKVSPQKNVLPTQKRKQKNISNTPKLVKRSLETFNAMLAPGKSTSSVLQRVKSKQKGRRNLLHSLEDQSEQSSENVHSDNQHGSSHATFDVCTSAVTLEPFAASTRKNARFSSGSKRASEHDIGFKSGPSSMIELERFEENEDSDLPSSRIVPHTQHIPRVMLDCDFCGPPLRPIVLEAEDWDNLCVWFAHLWPSSSKDGQVFSMISPDDFHWHSHSGRAMGHMVDLQNSTFSNGKILLGSYMKKPPQVDLHAVTVFNVVSSCVRVEIDGVKTIYNSGQAFMTPCGQSYSIHNVCREPAVLWYNRMSTHHTRN